MLTVAYLVKVMEFIAVFNVTRDSCVRITDDAAPRAVVQQPLREPPS